MPSLMHIKMKYKYIFNVLFSIIIAMSNIIEKIVIVVGQDVPDGLDHNLFIKKENKNLRDLRDLLIDISPKYSRRTHCLALLSDKRHSRIFTTQLMDTYRKHTYFMVVVRHGEDLLSPNYHTVESIEGIRHDGCETYLILLGDPFQAVRLLKFGDKYRVLDTSARYIMLHDYKLVSPDAHYLWYRIVRVIFLRRFSKKTKKTAQTGETSAWYELSTVPYPVKVKGLLVLKKLDYWRKGSGLRNNMELFRDKTRNLLGLPMSVAILSHLPAVKRLSKVTYIGNTRETKTVTVYTGLEIELVRALARAMNFTLQLYEPSDAETEMWGRKTPNGTYSGILGEMVGGFADFAVADLHYTQYNLQYMDLSLPYGTECLTFLTPEALFDNSWMTLILPFKPMMWLAIMIALFFLGFIFFGLAKYQMHLQVYVQKIDEEEKTEVNEADELRGLYVFGEIVNSVLYTFSMLLVVSLPTLPSGWSLRMLTGWYWLYCVLVAVSYRASLTSILANPAPRIRIDTLEQLSKSPISAGGWGDQHKQFFVTSLDEYGRSIGEKFETINNATQAVDRVARGEFAYYENKHFLREMIVEKQKTNREEGISNLKEANQRSLHIMDNCVINMPVSIGLQKNSPLLQRSDKFLRRAIETGLAEKWLSDVTEPLKAAQKIDDPQEALMDLKKLYGALIALAAGLIISFFVLIGECIHWKFIVQKKPDFDKYNIREYYAKK